MSERHGRRSFLKGSLATLAAAALHGCASEPAHVAVSEPIPKAEAIVEDSLIVALRGYITARYDDIISKNKGVFVNEAKLPAWGKELAYREFDALEKRAAAQPLPAKREVLAQELARNNLDSAIITQLDQYEDVPALERHFVRQGLEFAGTNAFGLPGYELMQFGKPYAHNTVLFDIPRAARVRSLEHTHIPNLGEYATEHHFTAETKGGSYNWSTKMIDLRPALYERWVASLDRFFRARQTYAEQHLNETGFLEKFITGAKPGVDFWIELGTQLRYQSLKRHYADAPTNEQAVARMKAELSNDVLIHETMHAADDNDYTFIDKSKFSADLNYIKDWNMEMRAFLATMVHGNSRFALTEMVRYVAFGHAKDPHAIGAAKLMEKFMTHLANNQKDYPNIEFTNANHVLAQYPKLTDAHIRSTARAVYDSFYRGRTLREFVEDFTK